MKRLSRRALLRGVIGGAAECLDAMFGARFAKQNAHIDIRLSRNKACANFGPEAVFGTKCAGRETGDFSKWIPQLLRKIARQFGERII